MNEPQKTPNDLETAVTNPPSEGAPEGTTETATEAATEAAAEPVAEAEAAAGTGRSVPEFKNNRELLFFLLMLIKENRKWWLLPLWLVLGLLGLFVGLTGNTSLLPAIYALF